MNEELKKLKSIHKKADHISVFPDETVIPWRKLTIGEYLELAQDDFSLITGEIPTLDTEDKIYTKCVTDEYLVKNIDDGRAGSVSTVSSAILDHSIIGDVNIFNEVLAAHRAFVDTSIWEQLVITILQAFPAYKPEDVYGMSIDVFLRRLALAEKKLIEAGIMKSPINLVIPGKNIPAKQKIAPEKLKEEYERQHAPQQSNEFVVTQEETGKLSEGLPREETEGENDRLRQQMIKEAQQIFGKYLDIQKEKGKITPQDFKDQFDNRIKDAETRKVENEKNFQKTLLAQQRKESKNNAIIEQKFLKGQKKPKKR